MTVRHHRLIITGTGRAGTTFLVELLSALGLDTGYQKGSATGDYFAHCHAGLEQKEIESADAPYIIKDPGLCDSLEEIISRDRVVIDHAIIPVRHLLHAAQSRERVGGNGNVPGGLVGTDDGTRQPAILAERFHRLIETLVVHDIPHTFLLFPRFAVDPDYTYAKLGFLLAGVSREQFNAAFLATARPDLIHNFSQGTAADRGLPARQFARELEKNRRRRRVRRAVTVGTIIAAALFLGTFSAEILAVLSKWFAPLGSLLAANS